MVDFNSGDVFTSNKGFILELVVLGRRDELLNTFQLWREYKLGRNSKEETTKFKLRAVLFTLFLELDRAIFRKLKKVDDVNKIVYEEFKEKVLSVDPILDDELIELYFVINNILDSLNLIKIDTKRAYDTTNAETENEEKGL